MTEFTPTDVRDAAIAVLTAAATAAGDKVLNSSDVPLQSGNMPAIEVFIHREDAECVSPAGTEPQFRTMLTLVVVGRCEGPTLDGVRAQIETLWTACKAALFGSPQFTGYAERFGQVGSEFKYQGVDAKGAANQHLGHFGLTIELQYSETYQPKIDTDFGGGTIWIDTVLPADPTGIYPPPFDYATTWSPRTRGPDGRVEVAATIDLPAP